MSTPDVFYTSPSRTPYCEGPFSNVLLEGLNLKFDLGVYKHCVGKPVPIQDFPIAHAKRQHIRGDGSCWARALWQVVFPQIFANEAYFHKFIQKVADSHKELNVDCELVKRAISALYALHGKSEAERIDTLNHENMDLTLVLYMRHLIVDFLKKNPSPYFDNDQIKEIKNSIGTYGGQEHAVVFCQYFKLEFQEIGKQNYEQADWVYTKKERLEDVLAAPVPAKDIEIQEHNRVIMFAVDRMHYEVLHFDLHPQVAHPDTYPEDLQSSLDLLAQQILKQIRDDAELAKKLQEEENAKYKQKLADAALAFRLQQQQHQQKPADVKPKEPPQPADKPVQAKEEELQPVKKPAEVKAKEAVKPDEKPVDKPVQAKEEELQPVKKPVDKPVQAKEPPQPIEKAADKPVQPQDQPVKKPASKVSPQPQEQGFFQFFAFLWARFLAFFKIQKRAARL